MSSFRINVKVSMQLLVLNDDNVLITMKSYHEHFQSSHKQKHPLFDSKNKFLQNKHDQSPPYQLNLCCSSIWTLDQQQSYPESSGHHSPSHEQVKKGWAIKRTSTLLSRIHNKIHTTITDILWEHPKKQEQLKNLGAFWHLNDIKSNIWTDVKWKHNMHPTA